MIQLKTLFVVLLTFFHYSAFASSFEPTYSSKSINGIKIEDRLIVSTSSGKLKFKVILSGTRRKQFALIWPKVYVAQIAVLETSEFSAKNPQDTLAFLKLQNAAALSLSFLRDLSSEKIKNGFIDGLKENSEDISAAGLKELLEAIESFGGFKDNTILRVGFSTQNNQEDVILEYGDKNKNLHLPIGTMKKLWSIWFGKPADSGLKEFQENVFK